MNETIKMLGKKEGKSMNICLYDQPMVFLFEN